MKIVWLRARTFVPRTKKMISITSCAYAEAQPVDAEHWSNNFYRSHIHFRFRWHIDNQLIIRHCDQNIDRVPIR